MFHGYKYSLKTVFRDKEMVFYGLAFPILLALMFNFALGNLLEGTGLDPIPVAIVTDGFHTEQEGFLTIVDALSQDEDALMDPVFVNYEEAHVLLHEGEVVGIYLLTEDGVRLVVNNQGIRQSILVMVADRNVQVESTISRIASKNHELIPQAIADITSEAQVLQEAESGRGMVDIRVYTLLSFMAMSCIYAAFSGMEKVFKVQANHSALAARRVITPTKRIKIVAVDFLASLTAHSLYSFVAVVFFHFVLDIQLADNLLNLTAVILAGTGVGVGFGMFIGAVGSGANQKTIQNIISGVVMAMLVLGGMMSVDVRVMIRERLYILDRMNPVTYLIDAFYTLTGQGNERILYTNILWMLVFIAGFCIVSAVILGRKSYDSI